MYGTDAKGDNATGTEFEASSPTPSRFENTESEWVKHRLHQYMSEQPCKTCYGTRLRQEPSRSVFTRSTGTPHRRIARRKNSIRARREPNPRRRASIQAQGASTLDVQADRKTNGNGKVKVALPGYSIDDVARMNVTDSAEFFRRLRLSEEGQKNRRADHARDLRAPRLHDRRRPGLSHGSTVKTGSLSGGEAQRIRLATQVGSGLVGVC